MHKRELLQRLTETQLKAVLLMDPIMRDRDIPSKNTEKKLFDLGIDPETTSLLLLSWARQWECHEVNPHRASSFYGVCDARTGSHEQRDHAIRLGNFRLLDESCGEREWFHFVQTGQKAISNGDFHGALYCFVKARKMIREELARPNSTFIAGSKEDLTHQHSLLLGEYRMTPYIEEVLHYAIGEIDFPYIDLCLVSLKRKLLQCEKDLLRQKIVAKFFEDDLDGEADEHAHIFLKQHASREEKYVCLDAVARRGDESLVEVYAKRWDIPVKERQLKLLLSKHWFNELNGDDVETAEMRIILLDKLTNLSDRYVSLLNQALKRGRACNLNAGNILRAGQLGDLIGDPLTFEELTTAMRKIGNDPRWHQEDVAFGVTRMIELVGPKAEPVEKNSNVPTASNPLGNDPTMPYTNF